MPCPELHNPLLAEEVKQCQERKLATGSVFAFKKTPKTVILNLTRKGEYEDKADRDNGFVDQVGHGLRGVSAVVARTL